MATQKPSKPNVTLPNNFGGIKTPYTQAQIDNGYQEAVPQVVDGGNINYEKDGVFKYLKYLKTTIDALVDMPIGKSLIIDSNNRFDYISPENVSNKTNEINEQSTENQYPNAKAVYEAIKDFGASLFQLISNLSQTIDSSTTKYPSNKAVLDYVESKAVPVGAFMPYAADTPPDGWLKCDGSAISRTTYSALFAKIGTKYGKGDGSKTFNLPNFIDKTFWGGSSSGAVKAAGLPNISGYISYLLMGENGQKSDGALSATLQVGNRLTNMGTGSAWKQLNFSAKDSNAIYGKSSTVQPPALTTIICIKY